MDFFSQYPEFDGVPPKDDLQRLVADTFRQNARYRALIEPNLDVIRGKRILDLGCFNGRWSFAAIKAGASFVCGVDLRQGYIDNANEIFRSANIASEHFSFVRGEVHEFLKRVEPGSFDTIFCFGILYHTSDNQGFLRAMTDLKPATILIDTNVWHSDDFVLHIHEEENHFPLANAGKDEGVRQKVMVQCPSQKALEFSLDHLGYKWKYFDWKSNPPKQWLELEGYRDGTRVSLRAERTVTVFKAQSGK